MSRRSSLATAWLACLVLTLLAPAPPAVAATEAPAISADGAMLVESTTGDVTFALRPDDPRPVASATKLMTALLALEHVRLSHELPASRYRPLPVESQLGLRPGEQLTVADLLRGLLLESANDAAATLAEAVSGSRAGFVRAMNERAGELGMSNTRFANPIGLDDPDNRSTPRDLVTLTRELQRHEFFRRTVARERVTLRSGDHQRTIANRNRLVAHPRVDGVKTGQTREARYVLVASGRSPRGVRLISVILGSPSEAVRNQDALELLSWGFGRYRVTNPVRRGQEFPEARVPIRHRRGAELPLMAGRGVQRTVRRGEAGPQTQVVGLPDRVDGPVKRGSRVAGAAVVVREGGRVVARAPLVASADVPRAGVAQRVKDAATRPHVLVGLLAVGAVTVHLASTLLPRRRGRGGPTRGGSRVA